MKKATLYSDGASRGNPGASGIGVVLTIDGHKYTISEHIGIATNNVAEYSALIKGLEKAVSLNADALAVFLDSELLVRQLNRIYKVKDEKLKKLWTYAMKLLGSFKDFSITHIPRHLNKEADALAKNSVKGSSVATVPMGLEPPSLTLF